MRSSFSSSQSDLRKSIIKITDRHLKGRTSRDITDQGLRDLKNGEGHGLLTNYSSVTKDGRRLRPTYVAVRDDNREPIAAICINFDLTNVVDPSAASKDIFNISERKGASERDDAGMFEANGTFSLNEIGEKTITSVGKTIALMGERIRLKL